MAGERQKFPRDALHRAPAGLPAMTHKNPTQPKTKTRLAFCLSQNPLCSTTTAMANTGNIKYSGNSRGGLDPEAHLWPAADKMRGPMGASES